MRIRAFLTAILTTSLSAIILPLGLAHPAGASQHDASQHDASQGSSGTFAPAVRAPVLAPATPKITAKAAYLVDLTTGTELYAKNADRQVPVASLAKVMTAYVVRQEGSLDDLITITRQDVLHAANNGASHAGLRAGERLTTRDLLYALMLPSAADAANALARRYGPGTARFVAKMNDAARDLGLDRTHYTNVDGLPRPALGGHSTARDQTRLAMVALADPVIAEIAATARHRLPTTADHRAHVWKNSNKLLTRVPGTFGLKTGFTRAAGFCLSFAAVKGGHTLFGTVLGDTTDARRFRSATRLLDIVQV
ncbi:serine hydrolase [Thermopolyspora sp. NPDC052614]|uniref:D-alanyl-D-alanine carboxypeptidase family protein n=1 Tax=Thermopolyspora sp. NPDC052614 TaxID=3155682 RepID=UPI0034310F1C